MGGIIQPTVAAMAAAGRPFKGVLYAGLMMTKDGPKLVEYNARFGDPECQVMMPAPEVRSAAGPAGRARRRAGQVRAALAADEAALTVVMAAKGYPGAYKKGTRDPRPRSSGRRWPSVKVFHAGTDARADGRLLADGGRVLGVARWASDVAEARERAYRAVDADRLAGGLLPPRYRLAGDPAAGGTLRKA